MTVPEPSSPPDDETAGGSAAHDRAAATRLRRHAEADRRAAADYLSSAQRDELTGALQRRPGRQQLQAEVTAARQSAVDLTVVFLDVDRLKAVNDRDGHWRGDQLLAATGRALRDSLRGRDVIVRYGGDEFVCALVGVSRGEAIAAVARVGRALDELVPAATVSAGFAQLIDGDSIDDVINRADADLYGRRRRRRTDTAPATSASPAIACGACGSRIDLEEFVLIGGPKARRIADCAGCGEATVIALA